MLLNTAKSLKGCNAMIVIIDTRTIIYELQEDRETIV